MKFFQNFQLLVDSDIEAERNAYLVQLKDLHVEDMIAAYQAYYDRVCN